MCDRFVVRGLDGSCPEGHPAETVSGRRILGPDEAAPVLPRFNLAAFLIPPIWGPAHGQWVGAIFLPVWLFTDSIIATAGRGGVATGVTATLVVVLTLAFGAFFAKRANGLAYRRVMHRMTAEEYLAAQRRWAIAAVPLAAVLLGWALWFRLVFTR